MHKHWFFYILKKDSAEGGTLALNSTELLYLLQFSMFTRIYLFHLSRQNSLQVYIFSTNFDDSLYSTHVFLFKFKLRLHRLLGSLRSLRILRSLRKLAHSSSRFIITAAYIYICIYDYHHSLICKNPLQNLSFSGSPRKLCTFIIS